MAIYVYNCPKTEDHEEHDFELLLPMSECGKKQPCPGHGGECEQVPYPGNNWVWGYNEVHWSAGTSGNPMGMNHAKRPGK